MEHNSNLLCVFHVRKANSSPFVLLPDLLKVLQHGLMLQENLHLYFKKYAFIVKVNRAAVLFFSLCWLAVKSESFEELGDRNKWILFADTLLCLDKNRSAST